MVYEFSFVFPGTNLVLSLLPTSYLFFCYFLPSSLPISLPSFFIGKLQLTGVNPSLHHLTQFLLGEPRVPTALREGGEVVLVTDTLTVLTATVVVLDDQVSRFLQTLYHPANAHWTDTHPLGECSEGRKAAAGFPVPAEGSKLNHED